MTVFRLSYCCIEFYKGKSGMKLANFMIKAGVDWTMEELGKYKAREETAINGTYGRTTIYTSSAPTSGPQLISLLNILSGFQLSVTDFLTPGYTHDLIETMRITQNQISKLGIFYECRRFTFLDAINIFV